MTENQIEALVTYLCDLEDSRDGLVILDRYGNTYLDRDELRKALTSFFSEGS